MKLLLIKCGICNEFYHVQAHKHCPNCGAFHVSPKGMKGFYVNCNGMEMVRGLPVNVDGMLNRLINRLSVVQ